jgi:hypothetical protein
LIFRQARGSSHSAPQLCLLRLHASFTTSEASIPVSGKVLHTTTAATSPFQRCAAVRPWDITQRPSMCTHTERLFRAARTVIEHIPEHIHRSVAGRSRRHVRFGRPEALDPSAQKAWVRFEVGAVAGFPPLVARASLRADLACGVIAARICMTPRPQFASFVCGCLVGLEVGKLRAIRWHG